MDRYAMNRCGRQPHSQAPVQPRKQCAPVEEECKKEPSMFHGLQNLPVAMAYVPCQTFKTTFELCKALQLGTIFPELFKPFCGERRGCR